MHRTSASSLPIAPHQPLDLPIAVPLPGHVTEALRNYVTVFQNVSTKLAAHEKSRYASQLTETVVAVCFHPDCELHSQRSCMTSLTRCVISVLISAVILFGQSLREPPSQTDLKTPGVFSVTIDSPPGKAPVALQWEFSVPPAISIGPADITIGKAAESARKFLTCATMATKPAKQRRMRYACILAGGQDPISNGPIAVVQYRAQWDVKGAPIRVAIENILGASVDAKPIPIPNADAIINIWTQTQVRHFPRPLSRRATTSCAVPGPRLAHVYTPQISSSISPLL
jgi:hypothetical protein